MRADLQLKLNHHRQLLIMLTIHPEVYFEVPDDKALMRTRRRTKASQSTYNGLINEGTTCYLNSLLQTLFVIRAFRRAVYAMPTNVDDFKSIPFCLQRIFYNLQTGKRPVRTIELLNAFGWGQQQMNEQHDVNEFFLVLSDTLEKQMRGTAVSGTYSNLFEGELENVVRCENIDYESSRKETFNCLQLSISEECQTIEGSLRQYVQAEELTGENQYDAEEHGRQDAKRFIRIKKLPPVLQVQVNRFAYNPEVDQMVKINSMFKFSDVLDLDAILTSDPNQSQPGASSKKLKKPRNLYHLHSILIHKGTLGAGHYFAFIKPTLEDQWFEFNDSLVSPLVKSTALSIGGGGFDSTFEHRDGQIFEKAKTNFTSAYMLVYIRDQDR